MLSIFLGLLSVALTIRAVGANSYGLIATLTSTIGILGFLDLGLGNALIGRVARAHATGNIREIRLVVVNTFVFLSLVGAALAIVGVTTALLVPVEFLPGHEGLPDEQVRLSLLVLAIAIALAGPASIGSKIAVALQRGRENNLIALGLSAVLCAACAIGLALGMSPLFFTVIPLLLPVIGPALQSIYYLWGENGFAGGGHTVSPRQILRMIPEGLPFTLLVVSGTIAYQSDIVVVTYISGLTAAAAYGLLSRIFNALTALLGGGLQQIWASTAHAFAEGDVAWVRSTLKRTITLSVSAYALLAGLSVAFAPEVVRLWSGGAVIVSHSLVLAFAFWSVYSFAMAQLSMILNGAGRVWEQAIASSLMAVVNLPLSVWLTGLIGPAGPLWGSLIAHASIYAVPTVLLVRKVLVSPQSTEDLVAGNPKNTASEPPLRGASD